MKTLALAGHLRSGFIARQQVTMIQSDSWMSCPLIPHVRFTRYSAFMLDRYRQEGRSGNVLHFRRGPPRRLDGVAARRRILGSRA